MIIILVGLDRLTRLTSFYHIDTLCRIGYNMIVTTFRLRLKFKVVNLEL